MTKYIGVVDTAKLIRKALKKAFPGQKFSVRSSSYAGGASIRVKWTDGPTSKQVDKVVQPFSGSAFDPMIDLKYSVTSWLLPDGSVQFGNSSGTYNGSDPGYTNEKPHPDAEEVNFGANFVFANRNFSKEFLEKVADEFSEKTGWDKVEIVVSDYDGSAYFNRTSQTIPGGQHYQTLDREYTEAAHKRSDYQKPEPKKVEQSNPPKNFNSDGFIVGHEDDWTWIVFQEKPARAVLTALKGEFKAGWSGRRMSWYIKRWVGREEIATCVRNALAIV